MKALITRKIGMTSTISEDGVVVAITLLSADPNVVTQIKTTEKDGYNSIQVGMGESKKTAKPQINHFAKSKALPKVVREFTIKNVEDEEFNIGDKISADIFSIGDTVHVTSTSKGKGFAGTIKRHNFHRGRKTHGGGSYRRPGSIGSMYPQKIFTGKKMAGRMGHERVTTRNLKVALVDQEKGLIGVVGAVPGPRKAIVLIKGAI
jgi:large subunit ribosomal protein L3